ncbi:MAG: ComEC family competence protein, partial [Rhodobacteraceae bacterium]
MPGLAALDMALLSQRGHLLPWAPVFLSLGIGSFFALRWEPGGAVFALVGGIGALAALAAVLRPGGLAALAWALALVAAGFCLAGWRSWQVAGPVLDFRYHGPIEGRIVGIDRSASDAVRLTLDRVVLADMAPERTPARVRVALHGDHDAGDLTAGTRVMTTGHLSPPQGAVEPGGFDFQRHSWFLGLGAVGYTRNLLLVAAPPGREGWDMAILRLRLAATARMLEVLPGTEGGFAAAVTTGDRSGIDAQALDWLRAANTAHLLAISGLHMGLLVGFVFAVLRHGLALIPGIALRWDTRKLAAAVALVAATFYLAISGGNVATERAYIMAAVMLVAVMLDRRAISLRSVAIAALIVLTLRPEALLGPGFQMSFAATIALVGVYGVMRDRGAQLPGPRWTWPVSGVLLSSLVAGLATAPVGAMHFNAISHYGLIANLLSVPMMGALVVPAAVVAAVLWPLGWEALGLHVMGLGLRWILWVAEWVAGWDGARSHLPSPEPWALPVLALGGLTILLWQGRARWVGAPLVLAALAGWLTPQRPEVLIADTGALV